MYKPDLHGYVSFFKTFMYQRRCELLKLAKVFYAIIGILMQDIFSSWDVVAHELIDI